MADKQVSDHARALAAHGSAKGGKMRAARLTAAERSEAARRAAEARWVGPDGKPLPRATHSGPLNLAGTVIKCAVLNDKTRLITQQAFMKAIGRAEKAKGGRGSQRLVDGAVTLTAADQAVAGLPPFLAVANLASYVSDELRALAQPLQFRTEHGVKAYGYRAELLPKVCDVYLQARREGTLLDSQARIAWQCEILQGGLATVGIIALVDAATGYERVRDRDELQLILEAYVAEEMRPWVRRFPKTFFEQCYRLRGWHFDPDSTKRNQYLGKIINRFIYEAMPNGVLPELQQRNPVLPNGRRRHKLHQFLTEDTGEPHLKSQIAGVMALMRAADSWDHFVDLFKRSYPDTDDHDPPPPSLPEAVQGTLL